MNYNNLLLRVFILVFFSVVAHHSFAANGNSKAGKQKSEVCQGCHGVKGLSIDLEIPHLAGQFAGYIERQVNDFKSEDAKRKDPTMQAMAATVASAQDLKDIAAYFSAQKKMKSKSGKTGNVSLGKKIFNKGVSKTGVYGCINCHGKNGKGKSPNNSLFPVIGGQQQKYLVKQLIAFKSGKRTNDPAGMMSGIARKLSKKEIDAVSAYISGL